MNIRKRILALMIVGSMLFLNGCVKVTELTVEEKEIIALYAAKVVSKHNVRLSQGLVRYRESAADESEELEEYTDEELEETADEDSDSSEESTENSDTSEAEDPSAESSESAPAAASLTDLFGVSGLEFAYNSTKIYNDLQGSNSYIEEPSSGCKYVGIGFDVKNTTGDDIEFSALTTNTNFTATLGSETSEAKSLAMLLDDLPTFTGTIKAGETKTLSIYFEFPEEATKDLSGLTLSADIDGKTGTITLK